MKKWFIAVKWIAGFLIGMILIWAILYFRQDIGIHPSQLEADIRSSQNVKDDWVVDGVVSDSIAAYISYPEDKSDYMFSVYVNRPGISFGYFFRGGGRFSEMERAITECIVEGYSERAFISMNRQKVAYVQIDEATTIHISSDSPFVIILPISAGAVTFYDLNGNAVEYTRYPL